MLIKCKECNFFVDLEFYKDEGACTKDLPNSLFKRKNKNKLRICLKSQKQNLENTST